MAPPNRPNPPTQSRGPFPAREFQQRRDPREIPQLPVPKHLQYYTDKDKKNLDPELLDSKAIEWAKAFLEKPILKTTQMRRFYDDLKAIERKIMIGKDSREQDNNFQRDRALIALFKAKAIYAEKRGNAPRTFSQFIFDHVASIQDLQDFKAFLKVFEAVVAFHKFYSPEK